MKKTTKTKKPKKSGYKNYKTEFYQAMTRIQTEMNIAQEDLHDGHIISAYERLKFLSVLLNQRIEELSK